MTEENMTAVRGAHSHPTGSAGPKESGQCGPDSPAHPKPNPAPPPDYTNEPASSTNDLVRTWRQFAKTFMLIFPIYALGYFEFSFSWLLIGLAIFFFWRRNTGSKNSRLSRALAFFDQEERSFKHSLVSSELPSWVRD